MKEGDIVLGVNTSHDTSVAVIQDGEVKAVYEEEFDRAATKDRDRSSFNVVPKFEYYRVG